MQPGCTRPRCSPRKSSKWEVERHLTGKETEAWEIIYFKLYKSQLAVVEQALETAALMLGTDKSRGYSLEMICADFLAGANPEEKVGLRSRSLCLQLLAMGHAQKEIMQASPAEEATST